MKFNETWLREWVQPPISSEQLSEQLTMAGFEVEALDFVRPEFAGVVVARVESCRPHPDADRLSICLVDCGAGQNAEVVCGADNVKEGAYFPFARIGATLPAGITIKQTQIKGIVSNGMLCSAAELGLSDEADRLMQLSGDESLTPGMDLGHFLKLEDSLFELSLTPNRGDCLSLRGLAREVAALNELHSTPPDIKSVPATHETGREVILHAPESCPRYLGRIIQGIDINRPTPSWLTEKLRRCGLRSINPVVDVSNYVLLELGQPTHAFDNAKLQGTIGARYAKPGESLTLLDEQTHTLSEKTLVITDESGPVAMAGIMGGLSTAVSSSTRDIFLECAYFSPIAISGRAREYGMHTDASHRYERGVDFELQRTAVERVSELILAICGGEAGPIVEACSDRHLPERPPVFLQHGQVTRLLGKEISLAESAALLERLELSITTEKTALRADIPSFRFDLSIPEDLVEEIVRLHGYQNVPSAVPRIGLRMKPAGRSVGINDIRQLLVNRDYYEVITYSFVDKKTQSIITGDSDAIPLLNPISSDMSVMRQSLLPGLLQSLQYNLKRQQQRMRLFEYGLVFRQEKELRQIPMIGGLIYGERYKKQWDKENISSDFYDIKGDIEAVLALQNKDLGVDYQALTHHSLHPGQSAGVFVDNQKLGIIGAIHPQILQSLDIAPPVYVFELEYEQISAKEQVKFAKISKFPSIRRDISILVDKEIAVSALMKCIKKSASELLHNLELFDVYQGEGIDLEKKSLALGLTFQASSSTLTDEEVEGIMETLLNTLHSEFGATLRE